MKQIVYYPMVNRGGRIAPFDVCYICTLIASYYKGYDTGGSRPYIMEIYEYDNEQIKAYERTTTTEP